MITSYLKQQDLFLYFPEVRSSKPRSQQGYAPSSSTGGESAPGYSSFWWAPALQDLWVHHFKLLIFKSPSGPPSPLHMVTSHSASFLQEHTWLHIGPIWIIPNMLKNLSWICQSVTELMLSNCDAGEDSWESLRQHRDQTNPSYRKSSLNIHCKDWCWSWSSNTLVTSCEELSHWKRPWCWERLRAGEGEDRRGDCWIASRTQWTWVWANSRR